MSQCPSMSLRDLVTLWRNGPAYGTLNGQSQKCTKSVWRLRQIAPKLWRTLLRGSDELVLWVLWVGLTRVWPESLSDRRPPRCFQRKRSFAWNIQADVGMWVYSSEYSLTCSYSHVIIAHQEVLSKHAPKGWENEAKRNWKVEVILLIVTSRLFIWLFKRFGMREV